MTRVGATIASLRQPETWRQGRTLDTPATRRWSPEQRAANDAVERCHVYGNFIGDDQGRSRVLIAACASEEDARLIVLAPEMLALLRDIHAAAHDWDMAAGLGGALTALLARLDGAA